MKQIASFVLIVFLIVLQNTSTSQEMVALDFDRLNQTIISNVEAIQNNELSEYEKLSKIFESIKIMHLMTTKDTEINYVNFVDQFHHIREIMGGIIGIDYERSKSLINNDLEYTSLYADFLFFLSERDFGKEMPDFFDAPKTAGQKTKTLFTVLKDQTSNLKDQTSNIYGDARAIEIGLNARTKLLDLQFVFGPWEKKTLLPLFDELTQYYRRNQNRVASKEFNLIVEHRECKLLLYIGEFEACIQKCDQYFGDVFSNLTDTDNDVLISKYACDAQFFKINAMIKTKQFNEALILAEKLVTFGDKHVFEYAKTDTLVERWDHVIKCHMIINSILQVDKPDDVYSPDLELILFVKEQIPKRFDRYDTALQSYKTSKEIEKLAKELMKMRGKK